MRTTVIGDVHGCIDELRELVELVGFRRGADDKLVLLGDLMDRGPDPAGCVRYAREIGADSVLGNHCEKHVRWRRRQAEAAAGGRPNQMRPLPEKQLRENEALSAEDMAWLASRPVTIALGGSWVAVHAGFEPGVPMEAQKPDRMTRIRWVDAATNRYAPLGEDFGQPPGTVFWAERYRGPHSVVYGHFVHQNGEPRQDEPVPGVFCVGIDTGCVYGGRLTAMVLEPGARPGFVQVRARREYYEAKWWKTRPAA